MWKLGNHELTVHIFGYLHSSYYGSLVSTFDIHANIDCVCYILF